MTTIDQSVDLMKFDPCFGGTEGDWPRLAADYRDRFPLRGWALNPWSCEPRADEDISLDPHGLKLDSYDPDYKRDPDDAPMEMVWRTYDFVGMDDKVYYAANRCCWMPGRKKYSDSWHFHTKAEAESFADKASRDSLGRIALQCFLRNVYGLPQISYHRPDPA